MADSYYTEQEQHMVQMGTQQERSRTAEAAQAYLQNIIDTGREPFLVLDAALRVVSANRAFYQTFQVSAEETESRFVYDLGNGEWDIPALRTLLEDILPGSSEFAGYEVEHEFSSLGLRLMLLNARKVYRPGNHSELMLLAIEDVTEERAAQQRAAEAHDRLQQAFVTLQADHAKERRIAQALQRPLLLEVPEDAFPGLSVATLYSSAWDESEVGGDFFDCVPLADKRVALLVGDASGKGIAAAARATEVKDVLRAFMRVYPYYPALTLTRLNDYLCDVQSLDDRANDSFIALCLVVVNVRKSEAVFAWAGIEAPVLVRADGSVDQVVGGGLPLGANEHEHYVDTTMRFRPGDTILLSTDGLSEARRGNEFLGTQGVEELLVRSLKEPTLKGVGQAVLAGASEYAGGKLHDDACLVLVRRC